MIEYKKNTDLFTLDVDAYAHGVNCIGAMGAGIAVQFKTKYPEMFKAYNKHCQNAKNSFSIVGSAFIWEESKPIIFNLFTQHYPGREAKLAYVSSSFSIMFEYALRNELTSIAMPLIGCGIGGLRWDDVSFLLQSAIDEYRWNGKVYVATL